MPTISTCLTYATQAEEAVNHYLSIFDGKIVKTMRVGDGSPLPGGAVISVTFELFGQTIIALNAGASFGFAAGMSLFVTCDTQDEIDRYWSKLLEGGGKEVRCGWITDKFGVSWQIVPKALADMLTSKDSAKAKRAMEAMMQMQKLDVAALQRAYDGA